MLKPFFINTNLCYGLDECQTSAQFFDNVGGNTGNSYIGYSIIKILYGKLIKVPEIKNIFSYDFKNQDELIQKINKEYSHIVFCLQDQLRNSQSYGIKPNWKKITEFISRIDKPFLVVSLGTNSFKGEAEDYYKNFNPELVRFVHILSEKSNSLGVRGLESERILHKLGINNVAPVGCPSFLKWDDTESPFKKKKWLLLLFYPPVMWGDAYYKMNKLYFGIYTGHKKKFQLLPSGVYPICHCGFFKKVLQT